MTAQDTDLMRGFQRSKTIEQNFADWESSAFGFGYGTGEYPVLDALKDFFAAFGVGDRPNSYDYDVLERKVGKAVTWLLINRLCSYSVGAIQYGTSPRYGWLTPEGEALKAFVDSKTVDELVEIVCSNDDVCYPDACNCGETGYEEGRICYNPFWKGHHE
jgi:hypothetical protein